MFSANVTNAAAHDKPLNQRRTIMHCLRRFVRLICCILTACLLVASVHIPVANAGIISTESVANVEQAKEQRQRLHELFQRKEAQAYLRAHGVDPAQAQARIDSMTDEEVNTLASRLDQLPAGGDFEFGDVLFVGLIVFVILLITDILGYTNVFPFVKHKKAH
jgi:hypothetical protein